MTNQNDTGAVRIRDMEWVDLLMLLRTIAPEIGRLQGLGDQLAISVMAYYTVAYANPRDVKANRNLRAAIEDYMNRDMRTTERVQLGDRFGHRLPEPEKEPSTRVFVPGTITSQ